MSSSSKVSPDIAAEIARLMRDPNALRSEREGLQRPGGSDHYDPNQPRVPAGNSRGGQWTSGGYRGGASDRDARVRLASLDGAQLAQADGGNRGDGFAQDQSFQGQLGQISTQQSLINQSNFLQTQRDLRTNPRTQATEFEAGTDSRFRFISTTPVAAAQVPGGYQFVVSSITYAYDTATGAYATILATPARPIEILEINGKLIVRPFR